MPIVSRKCLMCGNEFSRLEYAERRYKYCSLSCRDKAHASSYRLKDRFSNFYSIQDDSCWIFNKCKTDKGYGFISYEGTQQPAHRVSYKIYKGNIPDGFFVCHRCDNPPCVNPDHLWIGTAQDNTIDMFNKKRKSNKGSFNPRASLNEIQVSEIKKLIAENIKTKELSLLFGVSKSIINHIRYGKTWKHVDSKK